MAVFIYFLAVRTPRARTLLVAQDFYVRGAGLRPVVAYIYCEAGLRHTTTTRRKTAAEADECPENACARIRQGFLLDGTQDGRITRQVAKGVLEDSGILQENTGRRCDRTFSYTAYLNQAHVVSRRPS